MDFFDLIRQPLQGLGQISNTTADYLDRSSYKNQLPPQSGLDMQSMMQGRIQLPPAGGLDVEALIRDRADNLNNLGVMSAKEAEMLRERVKPMPYPPSSGGMAGGLGQMSEREYQELVKPLNPPMEISDAEYERMMRMAKGLL